MLNWIDHLLDRYFATLGATRPLTLEDRPRWAAAASLTDLGELTAQWLEGRIASQPGYLGPVDVDEDDAPGLTDTLVALNRAGYVTHSSQAGLLTPGWDGAGWRQRAAVTGLASPNTYAWLRDALAGTRFGVRAWPCKAQWWHRTGPGVPVTWRAGRPITTFGTQLGAATLTGEIYDEVGDAGLDAACAALQATVFDPRCGPNDLWPALRDAAAARLDQAWGWPGDTVAERRAARAAWAVRDPHDDGEGLYGGWAEYQAHLYDQMVERGPDDG